MTKSELKTGMIVTKRSGDRYMIFKNAVTSLHKDPEDVMVTLDGSLWGGFKQYREDMTHKQNSELDIMKVEECRYTTALLDPEHPATTIWERKEKKRYTYAQLREILGEEFEVVG